MLKRLKCILTRRYCLLRSRQYALIANNWCVVLPLISVAQLLPLPQWQPILPCLLNTFRGARHQDGFMEQYIRLNTSQYDIYLAIRSRPLPWVHIARTTPLQNAAEIGYCYELGSYARLNLHRSHVNKIDCHDSYFFPDPYFVNLAALPVQYPQQHAVC